MVTQVYPHIFKNEIPLPNNPLKSLNSYIIISEGNNLIIDTGFNTRECQTELMKGLQELNIDLHKTDLLVTHMHVDHSGLAHVLKQLGIQNVYFSQVDGNISNQSSQRDTVIKTINQLLGFNKEIKFGKEFGTNRNEPLEFRALYEGNTLVIGDYNFEVVDIPGHTPGHIGLYERKHKLFFCGDHILDEITPNITFWGFEQDILETYLNSLNKVYEYDIDYLFTAHRKIIRDHQKRIRELRHHHQERLNEIVDILKDGRKNPVETAACMSWDIGHKKWSDFPSSQMWFASGEALSHLEHLAYVGIVERKYEEGVLVYELK